jgi:hypothetical protein
MRPVTYALVLVAVTAPASATPVSGKLDLPPAPKWPTPTVRGFTDRVENPKKPVLDEAVGPQMLVVLEGDTKAETTSAQVTWELLGESFGKPVIGAPAGAEIVIKNCNNCRARTLRAVEDPKLISVGPINPTGQKSFKVGQPAIYTIGDPEAPHLVGKLVVVNTSYIAHVDAANAGKYDFGDVAEGSYKLRVFYKSGWVDQPDVTVSVPAKGKLEIPVVKIPAGYPLRK